MEWKNKVNFVHDADGKLVGVLLAPDLWERLEGTATQILAEKQPDQSHNLAEFADFLSAWTFRYPYAPAVQCPGCHAATENWKEDEKQPFRLKGASLGGILVFGCNNCGGTIRQKYFKTHMALEFSPPAR